MRIISVHTLLRLVFLFYLVLMTDLPKQYHPSDYEPTIYKKWQDSGAFQPSKAALKAGKQPYVIMLPPPNITGTLHIGHALQDTIMDILARYHRLLGEPVLWLPGTDHAAIATNKVIEQQLHAEGKTRQDIGRQEFMKRTEEWYDKTGKEIIEQMKRLGSSADWSRERFTMDEDYEQAVNAAFIHYYKKGYIYRGARIVNWDPQTQTTVSDLEIDWKTEKAPLYTFQYGPFQISTARPETKFGDKYVVMHPDDARYAKYKHGDTFQAEWINGVVTATVIKDEEVDPAFGTGVMTITPWHDATDFAIARRRKLDMEPIIDLQGKLLPIAGEFAGISAEAARLKIVAKLAAKGLLVKTQEDYEHNVALNDRGKGVIEPQVMRQWFVDMKKLKTETLEVARQELVRFLPERWKQHFITWMANVYDWNINRQIWLGHRLPVWWKPGKHGSDDEKGNFVVSVEKPEGDYEQDPDVLDTWFSSALWPFATLGWPQNTEDLKTFYPTAVLVTARDILYLWVARMIFSGLELMREPQYGERDQTQRIPFREVLIHPTVLAKDGRRMSKSLGTGIDPLVLINQYGADATRFGLMYQMTYDSQAIKFDENAIRSARNFANKIWNIARLLDTIEDRVDKSVADEWIRTRLNQVTQEVTQLLAEYKIGEAARQLHEFVWRDFADWYVEVLKVAGSTKVARDVFSNILRLLHPFMPHITEQLWQNFGDGEPLITNHWPIAAARSRRNEQLEKNMQRFQNIVSSIRSARTLLGIKPASVMAVYIPDAVPLPAPLAAMTHAKLAPKLTAAMKRFPLAAGSLGIASPEITPATIAAAVQKLTARAEELSALIKSQSKILSRMQGKAAPDATAAKEQAVQQAESSLQEIEQSLKLLQE